MRGVKTFSVLVLIVFLTSVISSVVNANVENSENKVVDEKGNLEQKERSVPEQKPKHDLLEERKIPDEDRYMPWCEHPEDRFFEDPYLHNREKFGFEDEPVLYHPEKYQEQKEFTPAPAPKDLPKYASHDPIYIDSNAGFNATNGVSAGDGSASNPYIIENWDINASTANGIEIRNTNAYFTIRNCAIHDGKNNSKYGIYFYNITNGKIENVTSYNNSAGILLDSSSNNNITNCAVYNNNDGILLYSSSNNNIISIQIYNNSYGIQLASSSHNNTIINSSVYNNNNYFGIRLYSSSNNDITNCTVYNNSDDGVVLDYSSNNQITNCNIYNNKMGIILEMSPNNVLRSTTIENNKYNFGVNGEFVHEFYQDIDTSNTINGKPIYYLVKRSNLVFDGVASMGFLGLVSCTSITVKNIELTGNHQGILMVNTTHSTVAACRLHNNSWGFALHKSSNIYITDCACYDYNYYMFGSSNIYIVNMTVYSLGEFELRNTNQTFFEHFIMKEWNSYLYVKNSTIVIADSEVHAGSLEESSEVYTTNTTFVWLFIYDSASVTLCNSSVMVDFRLHFYNCVSKIHNLTPSIKRQWDLGENSENISFKIRLINTTVAGWSVEVRDANLTIKSSDIFWIVYTGNSVGDIVESVVSLTCMYSAFVTVNTTLINGLGAEYYEGTIWLNNVTIIQVFKTVESNFKLVGQNISFESSLLIEWTNSTILRDYDILCVKTNGKTIKNVSLNLYAQTGILVWNGKSDLSGRARFNITFTDINYNESWVLNASKGGLVSRPITFFASSPIVIISPIADFTFSPSNPTALENVEFTDLSISLDGFFVAWLWQFGDSTNSTLQNPTHKYPRRGSYQASLTVWDDDGASHTINKTIIVLNSQPILSNITISPETGTQDTEFTFRITYSDADGDEPMYMRIVIDNLSYDMTKVEGDYVTGAVYEYKTKLSAGKHEYKFECDDGSGTVTNTASTDIISLSVAKTPEEKPPAKPFETPWLYIIVPVIVIVVLAGVGLGIRRRKKGVPPEKPTG